MRTRLTIQEKTDTWEQSPHVSNIVVDATWLDLAAHKEWKGRGSRLFGQQQILTTT